MSQNSRYDKAVASLAADLVASREERRIDRAEAQRRSERREKRTLRRLGFDALTACNACDAAPMNPDDARGYCTECGADADADVNLRAASRSLCSGAQ